MVHRLAWLGLLSLLSPVLPTCADTPTLVTMRAEAPQDAARYDLGQISMGLVTPLTHTFLLRNSGVTPLTIDRFQPSCHCTSAILLPGDQLPRTIAPGAQAAVRVSIVVEPYLSGPLEKYVQVYAEGHDSPVATLTLDATLHPLVVMNPLELDFGAVPAGHLRSLTLTATVAPDLIPPDMTPLLVSSDPDLHIAPLPAPPAPVQGPHTYAYRVTLAADAALGPVQDMLQFAAAPAAPAVAGMTLADAPGVPVTGTVRGQETVAPTLLAFGVVKQGHTAVLPVTLTAGNRAVLQSARAAVDGRFIGLHWARAMGQTRVLDITLAAKTPAGSLVSAVTITFANGQHVRLPVTAYVSAA